MFFLLQWFWSLSIDDIVEIIWNIFFESGKNNPENGKLKDGTTEKLEGYYPGKFQ